ncbi:S-adenosyl-L-methionine-dependent methyltransferase [Phyllosticta capitalensis]
MDAAPKSASSSSDKPSGDFLHFPTGILSFYDILILGIYCPYVWGCPASTELTAFLNSRIATAISRSSPRPCRILDIGVGTGYFLERAPLEDVKEITLLDINAECLDAAASRAQKAHPHIECAKVQANFLEPIAAEKLGGQFDIISLGLLLHCLPGPPARKADALVRLRDLLTKDGVLFGFTIIGKDATHSLMAKALLWFHNTIGVFDNYEDGVASFVKPLEEAFETVNWRIVGSMLLFEASKPK